MEVEENVELDNQDSINNETLEATEDANNSEVTTENVDELDATENVDELDTTELDITDLVDINELLGTEASEGLEMNLLGGNVQAITSRIDTTKEMTSSYVALSSVHFIISVLLILVVLRQSKSASSISSGNEMSQSYWAKNKGNSQEGKLSKATIILAVIFFIVTISINFFC